jgi:hypothetical protein
MSESPTNIAYLLFPSSYILVIGPDDCYSNPKLVSNFLHSNLCFDWKRNALFRCEHNGDDSH